MYVNSSYTVNKKIMSKIERFEQVTKWSRALNAARRTIGKEPLEKEPSKSWEAKILLAEHSPIRLVEFEWTWESIKQWVSVHLVRHHEGCEKFVHSQREDRRDLGIPRDELPQGSLNDMDMTANAQALINISRKRLCSCASPETREAWKQVREGVAKIDPVLADKMVPECQYRGFCPEWMKSCGYCKTVKYKLERLNYLRTDYNDQWTNLKENPEYSISRFGLVKDSTGTILPIKVCKDNTCLVTIGDEEKDLATLVASTFLEKDSEKTQIIHIDENLINNAVWNLKWI